MNKGLWNYAVKTSEFTETVDFYLDVLDGTILHGGDILGCKYQLIQLGESRIIVFDKAPYEGSEDVGELPDGFLHAVFEVDDFDEYYRRLVRRGVKILMDATVIETDWDVRKIAFFVSPEGVRTEVMQILEKKQTS